MTVSRRTLIVQHCLPFLALLLAACTASEQQVTEMAAQAQQLLDAGQLKQAQQLIQRAVRKRDDLPGVFLVQAHIAMALGKRSDAYQAYANALSLDAANPEALMGVAQTGLNAGRLNESDDAADKILSLDPNQTDAMLVKGIIRMVHNDLDGAAAFSDKVLALKPDDSGALLLKSRVLALQGNSAAGLALIRAGIAKTGETPELMTALAELQRQGGDSVAFLTSVRRIKELNPGARDYRFDLIDALYRTGQTDEARAEMTALIEEPATDLADIGRFARLFYAYDPGGLTADQIARATDKASIETRMELARYYIATGRPAVAATLLKPLATGWSNDIQARYARAVGATGNADMARQTAQTILARDPDNGDALLIQADASMARGDPAAAIVDYQRVVRDYPQWEEGYLGLARAYTATDKPIAVRRVLEDGRRALPQSLPFARAYTAALLTMGNGDRAIEVARRFAFDSPSLIAGWSLYGDICAKAGGSECRGEAAEGLRTARTRFGLDLTPGTPPPVALIGRLD